MAKNKGRKIAKAGQASTGIPVQSPYSAPSTTKRASGPSWKWLLILAGVLALLVGAVYANTLWMGLVFNDYATLGQLKMQDPEAYFSSLWLDAFTRPLSEPWVKASFALDLTNYGSNFGWYHLVNLFLHLSACLALFTLVFRLSWVLRAQGKSVVDPYRLAVVCAILYAAHPLSAQSATYISARYAPLCAANFLIALNFFLVALLGDHPWQRWWGVIFATLFAVMCLDSGQYGVSLPFMMFGLFFILKPPAMKPLDWMINRPLVAGILMALCMVIPFVWVAGVTSGAVPNFYGFPPPESKAAYVATQAKAFATYYTRTFFVPVGLSMDPPYTRASDFADVFALLGTVMLAGCVAALYFLRKQPILVFGFALLLAGYLPHVAFVQQERVADPIFYLSLAGLCTIAGWFIVQLIQGTHKQAAGKFAIIVVFLVGLSVMRNLDFATDEGLVASTLRTNPTSSLALTFSAMQNFKKNQYEKSLSDANQAALADPNLALAYLTKGYALSALKRYDEAKPVFVKAIELAKKQKLNILNDCKLALAQNYIHQNKPFEVNALVYPSLAGNPNNGKALYLLGMGAYERHSYEEAYMYLSRAAQSGDPDSLVPLSDTALRLRNLPVAFKIAEMAATRNDTAESQLAYGTAALAVNRLDVATTALTKALKEKPDSAEAMALLSVLYERKNDKVLAESYRKDATSRNADVFSELPMAEITIGGAAAPPNKKSKK